MDRSAGWQLYTVSVGDGRCIHMGHAMSFVKERCPHCDAINDLGREICVSCGKSMHTKPNVVAASSSTEVRKRGAGGFTVLLLIGSTAAAFFGMLLLSEATMGVGVIAFGIWLGIMARVSQAGDHYFGR